MIDSDFDPVFIFNLVTKEEYLAFRKTYKEEFLGKNPSKTL